MLHHSNNPPATDREPTPPEAAALRWVVRCDRGLTPEEERDFADWLAANHQHGELFAEFGGTWTLLGNTHDHARARSAESEPENIIEFNLPPAKQSAGRVRWKGRPAVWISLAAAAGLAFLVTVNSRNPRPDSAVATEIGASRQLRLSDGSVVALNTDSAVVPAFAADERRVRLQKGEAFFQVAKEATRPFVVEVSGVAVRAIGTAFNVRVHDASIEVIVTEGTVRVAPIGSQAAAGVGVAEVVAGQRVMVPVKSSVADPVSPLPLTVADVPADEVQRKLAWQGGRLNFSDAPLAEMVAEFNRYNRHKLVVPDDTLAAMRFGGSFRPDDRTGFVRMLRENFGIVAAESGEQTILRSAAP
jgi:transmembrane sensor